nr:mucin-1-like [Oryctolagus cuniculus]
MGCQPCSQQLNPLHHSAGSETTALAPRPQPQHRDHSAGTETAAPAPRPQRQLRDQSAGSETRAPAPRPQRRLRDRSTNSETAAPAPRPQPRHRDRSASSETRAPAPRPQRRLRDRSTNSETTAPAPRPQHQLRDRSPGTETAAPVLSSQEVASPPGLEATPPLWPHSTCCSAVAGTVCSRRVCQSREGAPVAVRPPGEGTACSGGLIWKGSRKSPSGNEQNRRYGSSGQEARSPEFHPGLPRRCRGPSTRAIFCCFPRPQQGAGSEVEQPELEPAPIWDACVSGSGLTHCVTASPVDNTFFNVSE